MAFKNARAINFFEIRRAGKKKFDFMNGRLPMPDSNTPKSSWGCLTTSYISGLDFKIATTKKLKGQ